MRAEVTGGRGSRVVAVTPRCPMSVRVVFCGVQTHSPSWGRAASPPSCVEGGSCFQGSQQVLALISSSTIPPGPS